jgi:hypothetical protein
MQPDTKLPKVGTTIFTVMSQLAAEHGAVNLGQGFPDFPVPQRLVDALDRAMQAGHNQYAMMTGIPRCARRSPARPNAAMAGDPMPTARSRSPAAPPRRSSMRSMPSCGPATR